MVQLQPPSFSEVFYPDSDGQPMADNTEQFRWIVMVKENLELLFANDPAVFVAGDLLWYPLEGDNKTRQAPDAMVAFGRPKGKRGSYQQWKEGNVPPQVVFEILSPGNTAKEMAKKLGFYDRFGVEEYYIYDPDDNTLAGWLRSAAGDLQAIGAMAGWVSPRLQIRFDLSGSELKIYRPDGQLFVTFVELEQQAREAEQQLEQERQRAEQERQRAEQAEARAAQLAEQLRSLGINPDEMEGIE